MHPDLPGAVATGSRPRPSALGLGVRAPAVSLLLLLVAVIAGCGGSGSDSKTVTVTRAPPPTAPGRTTTPGPTSAEKHAARAQGRSLLPTLSDLPAGWRETNQRSSGGGLSKACRRGALRSVPRLASASSPTFTDDNNVQAQTTVLVVRTPEQASQVLHAALEPGTLTCLADGLKKAVEQNGTAQVTGSNFGRLNGPQRGDQTGSARFNLDVSANGVDRSVYADLLLARYGRAVTASTLVAMDRQPDQSLEEQISQAIATRARRGTG